MGKLKVLGLIPARAGSKSIPNKNLVNLGEKPLISWTISAAVASKLDRVVVSTNDRQIAEVSQKYGAEVPFERPANLSEDSSLSIDVVLHALDVLEHEFDAVMLLQPTSPFRSLEDLRYIKDIIFTNIDTKISLVSTCLVGSYHPARMYLRSLNGNLVELEGFSEFRASRRQDLPEVYIRDGGFYVIGDDLILNMKQYNKNPICLIRNYPWTINIDGENDILIAQGVKNIDIQNDPNERLL